MGLPALLANAPTIAKWCPLPRVEVSGGVAVQGLITASFCSHSHHHFTDQGEQSYCMLHPGLFPNTFIVPRRRIRTQQIASNPLVAIG